MSHLGRRVAGLVALVPPQQPLLLPQPARPGGQLGDGGQVKVRVEVPEEGARDADQRPAGELARAAGDGVEGALVDDDLVVAGLDEAACRVLELLARLDEEVVPGGDGDGQPVARVAGPDVEAWVARAPVDGEEVEVCVEAG